MKKLIAAIVIGLLALALLSPAQEKLTAFFQFSVTNNHTVATNLLTGTNYTALRVTFIGLKAGGESNSTAVFVGPISNSTYYIIYPGERHIIDTQSNTKFNLKDWYLRTPSTGDGLTIIFQ